MSGKGPESPLPAKSRLGPALALVVGVALLAFVVIAAVHSWQAGERAQEGSAAVLSELAQRIPAVHAPKRADEGAATPTVAIEGVAYLGYVAIGDAGIELPVAYDSSDELLDVVPCRIAGDIATHDLVICGRRREGLFASLEQVPIGATVKLVLADGALYESVVSNLETVDVNDADYMLSNRNNSDSSADWDLTLFTYLLDGQRCHALRCELA